MSENADIPAALLEDLGIRQAQVKAYMKISQEFPQRIESKTQSEKDKESNDEKTPKTPKDGEKSTKTKKKRKRIENEETINKDKDKDDADEDDADDDSKHKSKKRKKSSNYPDDAIEEPDDPPELKKRIKAIKVDLKDCLKNLIVVNASSFLFLT